MTKIRKALPVLTWQNQWQNYWRRLSPRERWLMVACGILLAIAVVYWLIWLPYWKTRAELAESIPLLQKQSMAMHADEASVKTLKDGNLVVVIAADKLSQAISDSLARAGLDSSVEKLEAAGDGKVSLTAKQMPFAQWLRWLERLGKEIGVSVTEATITNEGEGVVRIEATLAPMSTG